MSIKKRLVIAAILSFSFVFLFFVSLFAYNIFIFYDSNIATFKSKEKTIESNFSSINLNFDGIYDKDPEKNKNAIKFDSLSFDEVLKRGLKVMDTTAFTLSQENNLPIIVFDINTKGNLKKIINGEAIGTKVYI